MRVPITLRANERKQLDDFVPRTVEHLRDVGLDDEADAVEDASIIDNEDDTFSAEIGEWASIVGALRTLRAEEGLRSWWLRHKLSSRLSRKVDELEDDGEADEDVTPTVDDGGTGSQEVAA